MSLVSIVIPAYNAGKYIAETIQSVISQTYSNWELIIVNDGSQDDTLSIIDSFSKSDPRIKHLTKNNSGVSEARNAGLSLAKGEFITFLDADDVWSGSNLEEKINFLIGSNADVVYSHCEIINEHSQPSGKTLTGSNDPVLNDILLLKGNYITAPSGIVLKKEILNTTGLFDPNLSNTADQDLWIRILSNGYKIGLLDKSLWKYRMHKQNMSGNISLLEKDSIYMFDKANKSGLFKSLLFKQKCFSLLYLMLAGSWWKNGSNKIRGSCFILKAIIKYPPIILNILK